MTENKASAACKLLSPYPASPVHINICPHVAIARNIVSSNRCVSLEKCKQLRHLQDPEAGSTGSIIDSLHPVLFRHSQPRLHGSIRGIVYAAILYNCWRDPLRMRTGRLLCFSISMLMLSCASLLLLPGFCPSSTTTSTRLLDHPTRAPLKFTRLSKQEAAKCK